MRGSWLFLVSAASLWLGCSADTSGRGDDSAFGGAPAAGSGGSLPGIGGGEQTGGAGGQKSGSGGGETGGVGGGGGSGDSGTGAGGTEAGGTGGGGAGGTSGGPGSGGDGGASGGPPGPGSVGRVIGYFTAWGVYGRDYHVAEIPAQQLTHVNYAFANISDDGRCMLGDAYADTDKAYPGDTWDPGAKRGSFHQLKLLKQSHPHLRTLISVGGWTWSTRFSDVASTPASREKFASSCVAFAVEHGFDGIDLDWEYPVAGGLPTNVYRPEDKHNYTLLLQQLRTALDAQAATDGRPYLLTIAAPAGPGIIANLEPGELAASVDWLNVMSYDFHGGWELSTNFNAPLSAASGDPSPDADVRERFNLSAAAEAYLAAGVPADKIVMGVPFYGRGWSGVSAANDGLFQSATGLPQGTWEAGVFDYADLAANYVPGYARFWHAEAKVPWLFDSSKGLMISYDDPESIALKAGYVRDHGLGGVMFWELSGDDASHSLLTAIQGNL